MEYQILGNPSAPTLICVPGLLGGPEDFASLIKGLEDKFRIVMLDPNFERRTMGFKQVSLEAMQEFDMDVDQSASSIVQVLDELKQERGWMIGVSLGGKIIYDFITKYPERFAGGIMTDMGPGSFQESDLFKFVDSSVMNTNLNLSWPEMKKDLQERVPERHIRSLIQTQLFYPNGQAPATWRVGMKNFRSMLHEQAIDDQFAGMMKVDPILVKNNAKIHVMLASRMSAITPDCKSKIADVKSIVLHTVPDSNHFLHISHKEFIQGKILDFVKH